MTSKAEESNTEIPMATAEALPPPVQPSQTTLSVVAPSDMVGGYEFFADAGDGKSYKVRVPDSGVKEGQRFDAIIVESAGGGVSKPGASVGHNIPNGKWRDGLCDCFQQECCKPSCCLGYWFGTCLLGQILTRNKLSWFGNSIPSVDVGSYKTWFALTILIIVTGAISTGIQLAFAPDPTASAYDPYNFDSTATTTATSTLPGWAGIVVNLLSIFSSVVSLLACIVTCRARKYLRERYNIPDETCGGAEDCCCAWWCGPCTLCQMARHTADYDHYPSTCCTATGLLDGAPEIV